MEKRRSLLLIFAVVILFIFALAGVEALQVKGLPSNVATGEIACYRCDWQGQNCDYFFLPPENYSDSKLEEGMIINSYCANQYGNSATIVCSANWLYKSSVATPTINFNLASYVDSSMNYVMPFRGPNAGEITPKTITLDTSTGEKIDYTIGPQSLSGGYTSRISSLKHEYKGLIDGKNTWKFTTISQASCSGSSGSTLGSIINYIGIKDWPQPTNCVDADSDEYYDETSCTDGTDLDDDMSDDPAGCPTDKTDCTSLSAECAICKNPEAFDYCENGIDEDGDGADNICNSCSSENEIDQTIFKIYQPKSFFGSWDSEYEYGICYNEIFGKEYSSDIEPHTCNMTAEVLRANKEGNYKVFLTPYKLDSENNFLATLSTYWTNPSIKTAENLCDEVNENPSVSGTLTGISEWIEGTGSSPHLCGGINNFNLDSNKKYLLQFSSPPTPETDEFWADATISGTLAGAPLSNTYKLPVCYGDLDCVAGAECSDGKKVVARLNSDGLVSTADEIDTTSYNTKICCSSRFASDFCGNEIIDEDGIDNILGNTDDEQCDDGDSESNDGCDSNCKIENGWTCDYEPSICTANRDAFWADSESGRQISSIEITNEGKKINLTYNKVGLTGSLSFEIFSEEDTNNPLTTIPATIADGKATAIWTIKLTDVAEYLGEEFYFIIDEKQSNSLTISAIEKCFNVYYCSEYSDEALCKADACGTGERSVEANNQNIKCDESFAIGGINYHYNCHCYWNGTKCHSGYNRTEDNTEGTTSFSPDWIGTCLFNENPSSVCSDEGFLSYSWIGSWRNGVALSTTEASNLGLSSATSRDGDFVKIGSSWYYDPITENEVYESEACTSSAGEKTVPCPSQLKVPFFSFFNFISAVLIISFIYLVLKKEKNI